MTLYGKSSNSTILQKTTFFEDNLTHVTQQKKISEVYQQQPIRKRCKNCDLNLSEEIDFIKDNIPYKFCPTCGHLNGNFQDTDDFCEAIYTKDEGESYSKNYTSKDVDEYNYRVSSIYFPKAEFLYTSLKNDRVNPNDLEYLDFGAGSGYFIAALDKIGLKKILGSEVSKSQVDFGNKMIDKLVLQTHNLKDTETVLSSTTANVISMIGVLEHLQEPREALRSIIENSNIQYLYLSIPLFSLSVYFEMFSDEIFHRQLHGGHTHLYSEQSLHYLINEFNLEIVSQWWFGTDMMDLYRNILVTMNQQDSSNTIKEEFSKMFLTVIDSLQLELDKKHYSSEVHILLKKK